MSTICIRRSLTGFSVEGGPVLSLGTAQRAAIDLAVQRGVRVTLIFQSADPITYGFSPASEDFAWMVLGETPMEAAATPNGLIP